ncbi:uncharacterized protein SPPG_00392 [Spizellomyces punctatus DAOM BR117]|uniref:RAVE subunit 2/Rogdi n=1 Tax=Spizellomyces punctatus (strain DAOM BR117) TaxID=645134 RepID=A0A0L0HUB9_SPIPD|nr:uncharacterized protein SPPG_00392 [Spizellomyces punctatus DAOM BR117]KND04677.1 hypothetical protein SPPG_00392 [Spizellomyces punctatus DAOM BR117]|eukprot:XP_016612716.1 hypothetical protein SPPG_00392 [Spizellomyces punctatus DAOM BR117]
MDVASATNVPNAPTTLSKEESVLRAELLWMLETQAPPLVAEVGTIIKTGLACCTPSSADAGPNQRSTASATLAVTSANSDLLKGFVTIDGTAIVKGELTLKLPHYNRGNVIKLTINSANPPVLHQVQTARNYLLLALEAFESQPNAAHDRDSLMQLLNRVSAIVKKAKAALVRIDESDIFPNKECDIKVFAPDLPDDLVVEFHVIQSNLVVSVYALNFHQPGIPLQFQSKILGKFKNIKLDTYKGRPVEILDELTVESASPRLATLVRSIDTLDGLCEEMRIKLQILR